MCCMHKVNIEQRGGVMLRFVKLFLNETQSHSGLDCDTMLAELFR